MSISDHNLSCLGISKLEYLQLLKFLSYINILMEFDNHLHECQNEISNFFDDFDKNENVLKNFFNILHNEKIKDLEIYQAVNIANNNLKYLLLCIFLTKKSHCFSPYIRKIIRFQLLPDLDVFFNIIFCPNFNNFFYFLGSVYFFLLFDIDFLVLRLSYLDNKKLYMSDIDFKLVNIINTVKKHQIFLKSCVALPDDFFAFVDECIEKYENLKTFTTKHDKNNLSLMVYNINNISEYHFLFKVKKEISSWVLNNMLQANFVIILHKKILEFLFLLQRIDLPYMIKKKHFKDLTFLLKNSDKIVIYNVLSSFNKKTPNKKLQNLLIEYSWIKQR